MPLRKLLVRLIFLCMFPLVLLALFLSSNYVDKIQEQQDQEAWRQVRNLGLAIDRELDARVYSLQALASSPLLDNLNQLEDFYEEAKRFRNVFNGHIILADLFSQMLFNTRVPLGSTLPKLPVPKGFAAAPAVLETGKPAVGDSFIGPIANFPLIAIVVPVLRQGELQALLINIKYSTEYQKILDGITLPHGYSISLLDSAGGVVASRRISDSEQIKRNEFKGEIKKFEIESNVSQWSLILEVPAKIHNKPFVTVGYVLASGILLAILISLLGGRFVGRILTRSIRSLTDQRSIELPITEIEEVRVMLEKSEEEIRTKEELYRSLFEVANVGKSITLPTGEMHVNKAFCDFLGYRQDELISRTWQDLTPDQDVEPIQNLLSSVLKGEVDSIRFKKSYIHKNGSLVIADVNSAIHRNSDGQPVHFVTTIVDITEQDRIENQLASALNYIQTIFDNSPVGIATVKADGEIITTNRSLAKIVGGPLEKIIGLNIHDIESWKGSGMLAVAQESLSTGLGKSQEFKYISSFDKECWVSNQFIPFEHEGEQQLLLLLTDIAESKKTEKDRDKLQLQLLQAQKMEAIGRLAGGVAHDFNNMLSVILGYTDIALQNLVGTDDPLYDDLKEVYSAAERSAALTRQLLAFARKQTVELRILNLNDVISDLLKMLRRLIGEDIDFAWIPGEELWLIEIDPAQVDQILANLCVNARDAISGVGMVTIETSNVTFDEVYCQTHQEFTPGEFVMIAVSDNGVGMDQRSMENIFEPFFSTKGPGEGTGLGLSTVYGIVKQHQGFINVYSELGLGSTFKIYLKKSEDEYDSTTDDQSDELPVGNSETILLVEDEEMILNLGQRVLGELGYKVLPAKNPDEALKISSDYNGTIDLILTDIVMPKMNGKELAEKIQADRPDLRILYMSGYTANVIAHHGFLKAGLNFVQKPFSSKQLAEKINKALNQ